MQIPPEAEIFLYSTSLAMGRMMPVFVIAPFLGGSMLPQPIRNAIVMSLVVFLYPLLQTQMPAGLSVSSAVFVGLMLKEAAIGTLIGFLISVPFWIASSVGYMVDNQRGATMADAMDPLSGESSSPLGNMVFQTLVMAFVVSGGLAVFLGVLLDSYRVWPAFSFIPNLGSPGLAALFRHQLDLLVRFVLLLSAPTLIICFLTDFGMGLMNRIAPQLNVFFMSMPIKSGLSMALLIAYWGALLAVLKSRIIEELNVLRLLDRLL
jgi:type III secretion protein T